MDRLAEHEAFLRAIFDAPDDDTPRLVYADFLDENGEPERAELIRLQCELARTPVSSDPSQKALRTRERELLGRLHPELDVINWSWEEQRQIGIGRGFVTQPAAVVCPGELDDVRSFREKIVRSRPHWFGVNSLSIQEGWFLHAGHLDVLFNTAALEKVTDWDLGGHVEEIAGGPQTEDAGTYALIDMHVQPVITVEGVEALAGHRGARRIQSLILINNNLDNDAARALVRSPYLIRLQRLDLLEGNRLHGRTWQQLLEKFGADVVG
jgi:uncharacterized protein (TIGR02996 family)